MPCNQVIRTRLRVRDDALLAAIVGRVAQPGEARNIGKSADGTMVFTGYVSPQTQRGVTSAYADALLVRAFAALRFTLVDSTPLPAEVAREIGPGVQHRFMDDAGRTVTVGRADDGRLHFEMAGYSGYEAQDAANLLTQSLREWGLEPTEPLTVRTDEERWLEERVPDMETE